MKALIRDGYGSPGVLEVREVERPVRSLNPRGTYATLGGPEIARLLRVAAESIRADESYGLICDLR